MNYGPQIRGVQQILQFGASEKESKENQIGQHGEGLKRAALKFIEQGFRVEAFFPVVVGYERTEFRHLVFKLVDKDQEEFDSRGCLAYSLTTAKPHEGVKGTKDFHRFQIAGIQFFFFLNLCVLMYN